MSVPNLLHIVIQTKDQHPQAWKDAHTGNAHTDDFILLCAAACHQEDVRIGNNGKRGDPSDISDDALNFMGEGADFDPTRGNMPCTVIDVIGSAGTPQAFPQWAIVTNPAAPVGAAWVQPDTQVIPEPPHVCPPVPPTFPYPDENGAGRIYQSRVKAAYAEAGRTYPDPNDPNGYFWTQRYGYSCRSMPEPDAADKHIKELRAALGLP